MPVIPIHLQGFHNASPFPSDESPETQTAYMKRPFELREPITGPATIFFDVETQISDRGTVVRTYTFDTVDRTKDYRDTTADCKACGSYHHHVSSLYGTRSGHGADVEGTLVFEDFATEHKDHDPKLPGTVLSFVPSKEHGYLKNAYFKSKGEEASKCSGCLLSAMEERLKKASQKSGSGVFIASQDPYDA
jgi:hypothetical protein